MRQSPRSFKASESAIASIEFALLLPLLILLSLGAFELQRFLRFERQLTLAASNIASLTAQRQATNGGAPREDINSMPLIFPMAADFWYGGVIYRMTHVVFTPTTAGCTINCQYKADVAWVWPIWTDLGSLNRDCGPITPAPAGAEPHGKTLPAAMFGPGSLVIVELRTTYQPIFGAGLIAATTLTRQGFASPRFASPYLKLNPFGNLRICPGFT